MHKQSTRPEARRRAIVDLLQQRSRSGNQAVRSQHELGGLLAELGVVVNQATLSRDLRELGVVKGPDGYRTPFPLESSPHDGAQHSLQRLERACAEWLSKATPALNQIVLLTPPGGAQPLAVALDNAALPGVLGTLAGDDTILVICKDARTASKLASKLKTSLTDS